MQRFDREPQTGLYIPENAKNVERKLWVSPDVSLVEPLILQPGDEVKAQIQLTRESIPKGITLEEIRLLRETPRSRYAQVFLEIEDIQNDLYQFFLTNGLDVLDSGDPQQMQPRVTFKNYATCTNEIEANGGVARIYLSNGEQLRGDALFDSPIRVDGEPIRETMVRRNDEGVAVALRLTLDPATRMWIPPSRTSIHLDPHSPHQREQIKKLLVPVPETDDVIPYLVFSKERLSLPKGFYGIVRQYGYAGLNGKETHRSLSTHGNSQLFDPDRDWHMIFELRGRTTPDEVANFIDVDLFQETA